MLKCASAYTYEIDDPAVAIDEIRSQLEKTPLMKNTVGIIMCNPEYIASGVVEHLCRSLPYGLVGITTSSQAVNGEAGELMLTVFIMTSDDVVFKTGVTGSLDDGVAEPVVKALGEAAAGIPEMPKLALIFPPLLLKYAGDAYIEACRDVLPGVPVFGSFAVDDTLTFEGNRTICGGEGHKDSMAFVLCYGNISPRFLIGTLPDDKTMPYKGEITKSSGPYVREINNMSAYKYFESIGFTSNGALADNYLFVPFVIDQKKREDYDGVPVIRGHASFTEDGGAIFRGNVDEGSTFTLLTCGPEDILKTTREKIAQINAMPDVNGALLFPCIVRRMILQRLHHLKGLETVRDGLDPGIPFMMGYSGGEICPTSFREGVPVNRFHNYSLVILVV